jgi:hypothetical protein
MSNSGMTSVEKYDIHSQANQINMWYKLGITREKRWQQSTILKLVEISLEWKYFGTKSEHVTQICALSANMSTSSDVNKNVLKLL